MAIQWFPGHMHKARKEMLKIISQIDLIIEVLDARIPYSSENPMLKNIRGSIPCIKLLNKFDLADPLITSEWIKYLEQEIGVKSIAISALDKNIVTKITDLCTKLVPKNNGKNVRTMVVGIPNVGKSTLINMLAGRIIAKTGNEPAVTKAQQRINLQNGIVLIDTPGVLWPKVENISSGYRLAITGAIKDTAIEYDDVAMFAAEYFLQTYPNAVMKRYKLDALPCSDIELLEAIGSKRGAFRQGGYVDLHKASELLLHEFRSGKLGKLSLESPQMVQNELKLMDEEKI